MKHYYVYILAILLMSFRAEALLGKGEESRTSAIEGRDLMTGKVVRVDSSKTDKGWVIAFLSSRCPCSRDQQESLNVLAREYEPKGFKFLAIHSNVDEPETEAKAHFTQFRLSFPIIQDENGKLANQWKALNTPHIFIATPSRDVLYQGGIVDSRRMERAKAFYLAKALRAISEGKSPSRAKTRPVGCFIKR